jgi:hypothetical protein
VRTTRWSWRDNVPEPGGLREVSKAEFREAYFRYGRGLDGWTQDYWIRCYEQAPDRGMRWLLEPPAGPRQTRMMIVDDYAAREHRLFFLDEAAEERLFHPGTSEP